MSEIAVSVYCLAYNHERYIRDALEGFVNQKTNFKYEVYVHDDASTDKTPEIIKEYAEKYPNIIKPIFQKENQYSQGVNISQDIIYPRMSGKYIATCEGDDYWCDENKLQVQYDFLEAHDEYSACTHNTKLIDCRNGEERLMYSTSDITSINIEDIMDHGTAMFHLSSLMMRKEYFIRPKEFYARGFGDYPLSIYLAMSGKIYYSGKIMSVYRWFTIGSWNSRNTENVKKAAHFKEVIRMLNSINEYSNGKYYDTISRVILNHQVLVHIAESNYKAISKNKYMKKYYFKQIHSDGIKAKIMFYLRAYVPFAANFYYKLKGDGVKNDRNE